MDIGTNKNFYFSFTRNKSKQSRPRSVPLHEQNTRKKDGAPSDLDASIPGQLMPCFNTMDLPGINSWILQMRERGEGGGGETCRSASLREDVEEGREG